MKNTTITRVSLAWKIGGAEEKNFDLLSQTWGFDEETAEKG
jgi:hypothetical protein